MQNRMQKSLSGSSHEGEHKSTEEQVLPEHYQTILASSRASTVSMDQTVVSESSHASPRHVLITARHSGLPHHKSYPWWLGNPVASPLRVA